MKSRIPGNFNKSGSVNNMLKQAQKMQSEMSKIQEDLNNKEFSASSGGGAVSVVILGNRTIKSINLKPEIVDPDDIEMLQDLIVAALNQAISDVDEESNKRISNVTGNLSMPGLF